MFDRNIYSYRRIVSTIHPVENATMEQPAAMSRKRSKKLLLVLLSFHNTYRVVLPKKDLQQTTKGVDIAAIFDGWSITGKPIGADSRGVVWEISQKSYDAVVDFCRMHGYSMTNDERTFVAATH